MIEAKGLSQRIREIAKEKYISPAIKAGKSTVSLRVRDLMEDLRKEYTIVIVTHNMQQAARVSQQTGFFMIGELKELAATQQIFTNPQNKETEDYVSGRFG